MAQNLIFDILTGKNTLNKDLNNARKNALTLGKSISSLSGAFGVVGGAVRGLSGLVFSLQGALAGLGAAFTLKAAIDEANNLTNSLIGLQSVASALGENIDQATEAAKELSRDGLIPLNDVSRSLKNLLAAGLSLPEAIKLFKAFRDSAAFNRQGTLGLAEAVSRATDGFKNQLSTLVDNAGITKNLSVLQKEYAASIGKTVGQLTEAEKTQANFTGILKEASIFQGDYNRLVETFSGLTSQASGTFRFLLAEFGELITKNPLVIDGIRSFTETLQNMRQSLKENRVEISQFVLNGFAGILSFGPNVAELLKSISNVLVIAAKAFGLATAGVTGLINSFLQFGPVQSVIENIIQAITLLTATVVRSLEKLSGFKVVRDTFNAVGIDADGLTGSLKETADELAGFALFANKLDFSPVTNNLSAIETGVFSLVESIDKFKISGDNAFDGIAESAENLAKRVKEISKNISQDLGATPVPTGRTPVRRDEIVPREVKTNITLASRELLVGLTESIKAFVTSGQLEFTKLRASGGAFFKQFGGQVTGAFASALKGGSEGAKQMVAGIANALVPGLGPVVELLSLSGDQLREALNSFFDAIPQLIERIISNIPVLVESLAGKLRELLPRIVAALANSMPLVAASLAAQAPFIAISFAEAFISQIPNMVKAIGEGIINAIKEGVGKLTGGLLGGGGSGGIGGVISGVVGSVGKVFGFAQGGIVKSGFPNDTAPALLTSGERVLSVDTNRFFEQSLEENNNKLDSLIQMMGQQQVIEADVQLNQEAFAKIMLKLDRTGLRTRVA